MHIIGIDLGGTKIEGILVKENVLKPILKKRIATEQEKGYASIVQKIVGLVKELSSSISENFAVGIGVPGLLHPRTKMICNSNTQALNEKNLKKDLEDVLKVPVFLENDANCFALSEAHFGAGKSADLVLGIIMGTGMGAGLIYQKNVVAGFQGYAGEVGHISIDANGKQCWCGNSGCAELYLSGTGMTTMFQEKYQQKKSVSEIYELYLAKKSEAIEFMDYFLDLFGRVIANFVYALCPQKIVLGGGVSNLPLLYKEGMERVAQNVKCSSMLPELLSNELGDSSGVYGAATLPNLKNFS